MERNLIFSVTKKDLKIEFFSGTGGGGQYRNKHQNCVRIHHSDSGVIVTGQSYRERTANIREALNNLKSHPKFKVWVSRKLNELETGKTLEQIVDDLMKPENMKVEVKQDDKWIEATL